MDKIALSLPAEAELTSIQISGKMEVRAAAELSPLAERQWFQSFLLPSEQRPPF
jgi:hypothetical protein